MYFVPVQFFPGPCRPPGYNLWNACSCCKWTWYLLSGSPSGICWWCKGLCLHQHHSALRGHTAWGLWRCWETQVSPGWSDSSPVSWVWRQAWLPPLLHLCGGQWIPPTLWYHHCERRRSVSEWWLLAGCRLSGQEPDNCHLHAMLLLNNINILSLNCALQHIFKTLHYLLHQRHTGSLDISGVC